jgi:hypothetical protein
MKLVVPVAIALLGLGAGVGAGVALKPEPETKADAEHAAACPEGAEEPCAEPAHDPLAPPKAEAADHGEKADVALIPLDKPFVVPVFRGDAVAAMVVASVAVEIGAEAAPEVEAVQPRLRDSFLAAMFLHANSGGFDGAFTAGRKMEDLRAALLAAAQKVIAGGAVSDVLITEIARQDV